MQATGGAGLPDGSTGPVDSFDEDPAVNLQPPTPPAAGNASQPPSPKLAGVDGGRSPPLMAAATPLGGQAVPPATLGGASAGKGRVIGDPFPVPSTRDPPSSLCFPLASLSVSYSPCGSICQGDRSLLCLVSHLVLQPLEPSRTYPPCVSTWRSSTRTCRALCSPWWTGRRWQPPLLVPARASVELVARVQALGPLLLASPCPHPARYDVEHVTGCSIPLSLVPPPHFLFPYFQLIAYACSSTGHSSCRFGRWRATLLACM